MGLVQEVPGHRCAERGNRRYQLCDLTEHVAGVPVPCLPDDPFGGCGGRVDFSHAQVGGCLDGGALGTRAAVAAQAPPNGFRRVLFGLARTAEVPVGAGSVTQVAAFVEVQPFRLRPVSDEGQGFRRFAQGLLAWPASPAAACAHASMAASMATVRGVATCRVMLRAA